MNMRNRIWIAGLAFFLTLRGTFPVVSASDQLTRKQAEELLLNIPDAARSKASGGCPKAYLLWANDKNATIFFAIHDPCNKSGSVSDKIGNYTVDLNNGEVWSGVDRPDEGRNLIDSKRMKELRQKFFGRRK